jgi:hypothetical protein
LTGIDRFDPGSHAIWTVPSRSDGGWRDRRSSGAPAAGSPPVSGGARGNSSEPTHPTARRRGFQRDLHRDEARDALSRSRALRWAHRRRRRRAAWQGGLRLSASHGEREARHRNLNGQHRGTPHLAAKLRGGSKTTARRRRCGSSTTTRQGLAAALHSRVW